MNDLSPHIKQGIAYAIGRKWVKISKKCALDGSISLEEFIRANVNAGSEDIVYASKLIEILGNMCFRIDDFILIIVLRDKKISQRYPPLITMTSVIQRYFTDTDNPVDRYFKDTLNESWKDLSQSLLYDEGLVTHLLRYVVFKRAFSKAIEPAWKEIVTKCHHWALKYDSQHYKSGLLPKSIKNDKYLTTPLSDTEYTLRLLDKLIRLVFPLKAFIDIIFDTGSSTVINNINELLKNTPTKTTSAKMIELFSQKYKDWSRIVVGIILITDTNTSTERMINSVPKYGMTLDYITHNKSKRLYGICKNDKMSIVYIAWKPRSISDISTICDEMIEDFKLDYLIYMSVCQLNMKTYHKDVVIATKIHSSAGGVPMQINDISDHYLKDLIQSFNNWTIEQQSNENDIYRKIDKITECLYHNIDGMYPPTIKSDAGFSQFSDDWSTFITAVRDGKDDRFILRRNPTTAVCLSDSYRKQLDQQVSKDGKLTISTDPKIYYGSVLSTHGIHYTVFCDTINEMISSLHSDNLRATDQFGYSVFIHADAHNNQKCPHQMRKKCKQCISPKQVHCLSVNVVANHYESVSDEHCYDYALFIFQKFTDHFTHFIMDLNESPTIPIIQ